MIVFPCIVVVGVGAGLGGEGVVKPNRVPLGVLPATTMSNRIQQCLPCCSNFTGKGCKARYVAGTISFKHL